MRTKLYKSSFLSLHYAIAVGKNSCFVLHCNVAYRYAIFLCSHLYLSRPKKSSWVMTLKDRLNCSLMHI